MLVKKVPVSEIEYTYKEYDKQLIDSLSTRGILISLKLSFDGHKYVCIDGHKRLSCILETGIKITEVSAIIVNDFSKQGSAYWGPRNRH